MKRFVHFAKSKGLFWFRLWNNYGLSFTDHRVIEPCFSERQGIGEYLHVGPFCIEVLKPDNAITFPKVGSIIRVAPPITVRVGFDTWTLPRKESET